MSGYALRFLGVGSALAAAELGSACAVLERDGAPLLMIDCGQEALTAYLARYGEPPAALFLTHAHMDHVAGMERLFIEHWFGGHGRRGRARIYAAATLVPLLQQRVAGYPRGMLAEGGSNYWDAFQLVPFGDGFWHAGLWFDAFATRHHAPAPAHGLRLRGAFTYTGDTRPIPEVLVPFADTGELIAHDCGLVGNPSHTGLDDLAREYPQALRQRLLLYHYGSAEAAQALAAAGYRVAVPGHAWPLPAPDPSVVAGQPG